ncbi:hypothetical protein J7U39_00010 [Rhizobium sp. NLR16a]|nr:hypothetical protein J7U39_00010 [Rhizobium sp. NLR16a]
MKSRWQADLRAFRCASVGWCGGAPVAGAGVGSADVDLGLTFTAETAFWQPAESVALCCWRQVSASIPPGVTPEHFAMKSERHSALIASRCSSVGACEDATPAKNSSAQNAGNAEIADRIRRLPCGDVSREDPHFRMIPPYKSYLLHEIELLAE